MRGMGEDIETEIHNQFPVFRAHMLKAPSQSIPMQGDQYPTEPSQWVMTISTRNPKVPLKVSNIDLEHDNDE